MATSDKMLALIKKYSRAIVHMRAQKELKRFGLIFGAGISKGFGFPSWDELINRIACDERVNGEDFCEKETIKTSLSQLLFQKFKTKETESLGSEYAEYDKLSAHIQSKWSKIVHDALYLDVPKDINELKSKESYLFEYLDIIKNSKLTINYNFDDTIQTLLADRRTEDEKNQKRGYRTIWNANIQLYPQDGVIYHPNGFLPHDISERPSDDLIFLEDSFGDQLIDSSFGHYAALSYHLSQNTCLFIGLSLEDSTLKHLLRKNANLHPGHVQYYVYFLKDTNSVDSKRKSAIIEANFDVHNLITMFLDDEDLTNLAKLLKINDEDFEMYCAEAGVNTSYKYFLTGSVSVGKSTAVSNFRSLRTHDEWLERRTSGMEKDPSIVSEKATIEEIDQWVVDQWRKKNFILSRKANHGIHIIDRCPLDAFAFTPEDKWVEKAEFTRKGILPNEPQIELVKGKIILMIGDPEIMSIRALKLQKQFKPSNLKKMQELLKLIYDQKVKGIVEIDTRDKTTKQIAKEISKMIHLDNYEECNMRQRLEDIESGAIKPPDIKAKQPQAS